MKEREKEREDRKSLSFRLIVSLSLSLIKTSTSTSSHTTTKKTQPFRRRGAHPSPSRHHRGDPSESGGFGGRRRDGNNGTAFFNSSSAAATSSSSSSLGTKLLKLFLANWDRALVLAALIAATVLVSTRGVQFLKDALAWLQRHSGWAGWGVFTASYAAAVSLLLPGVAAVLGAGFVFGFWRGLLAVWLGGAAGQVGAFLLSRYLLGRSVSGLLGGSRLWASVDAAMEAEGWKLLLLLRLSPVIPYNLLNLAAAATSVGLLPFALASAVGIVPECALLVYAGELVVVERKCFFFFFEFEKKKTLSYFFSSKKKKNSQTKK